MVKEGDFSRPAPTRFWPLLFIFLWLLFSTKYDKIMSLDELKFAQKEVSVKDRGSNETLGKIEADFLDVSDAYNLFRAEVNASQTDKSSGQVSAVP